MSKIHSLYATISAFVMKNGEKLFLNPPQPGDEVQDSRNGGGRKKGMAAKRAAVKRRNVLRHRRATR